MSDTQPLHWYTFLSRTTLDWSCPRKRWWGYHALGRGLQSPSVGLELFLGSCLHDGLAAIATQWRDSGSADIDAIATTTATSVLETLAEGGVEEDVYHAHEQAALVEGLLRGFYKHAWMNLISQYPKVIAIEQEVSYPLGDNMTFECRPDLILGNDEAVVYVEHKSTSSKSSEWVNQWNTAVQIHSTVKAIEHTMGITPTAVIVQGLYKGYCLVPETPVLTSDLRWVGVGSLVEGDKLAGFDEHSGNNRSGGKALREWREAIVTKTGRQELPAYEIALEDGTVFTCSENHQWLIAQKAQGMGSAVWKTTKNLTTKHRIVKLIEPWKDGGEFTQFEAGYLAAAFDGEGCLAKMNCVNVGADGLPYKSVGLAFTQKPNGMLDYVKETLGKYGYYCSPNNRVNQDIETLQIYGKINVMGLMGKLRPKRLISKWDFNSLGMIKDLPTRPVRITSIKAVGLKEVVSLETSTGTLVANGFASHNSSYGKQNSPFCHSYFRQGTPPFSYPDWQYAYKSGYKRTPTWEMEGGVKKWVDEMPERVLADIYPCTPPIFVNEQLVADFFAQRQIREVEIREAVKVINDPDMPEAMRKQFLNCFFPQRYDQCNPSFGRPCGFRELCFGNVTDPIARGWTLRDPHFAAEAEQLARIEALEQQENADLSNQ